MSAPEAKVVEAIGEMLVRQPDLVRLRAEHRKSFEMLERHRDVLHRMAKSMESVELLVRSDLPDPPVYLYAIVFHAYKRAALLPSRPEEPGRRSSESFADWGDFALLPTGDVEVRIDRTGATLQLPRRLFAHRAEIGTAPPPSGSPTKPRSRTRVTARRAKP